MQKVQRKFGKVLKRSADTADVATILHEFQLADELLDKASGISGVRSAVDILTEEVHLVYQRVQDRVGPDSTEAAQRGQGNGDSLQANRGNHGC